MKYLYALVFCLSMFAATAQESLQSFERIVVCGNVQLMLQQGNDEGYTTSGHTKDLKVRVEGGKLRISRSHIWKDWDKPSIVEVTYKDLRSLYASAGARIEHKGTMNVGDFDLSVDTGAHGDLVIDAQALEVRVGEGGVLRLEGSGRLLEASSNTGGVLKARDFIAQKVYVKANTGALASVHATESIEANASLGGAITYSGNPGTVKVKESLGGSVRD